MPITSVEELLKATNHDKPNEDIAEERRNHSNLDESLRQMGISPLDSVCEYCKDPSFLNDCFEDIRAHPEKYEVVLLGKKVRQARLGKEHIPLIGVVYGIDRNLLTLMNPKEIQKTHTDYPQLFDEEAVALYEIVSEVKHNTAEFVDVVLERYLLKEKTPDTVPA